MMNSPEEVKQSKELTQNPPAGAATEDQKGAFKSFNNTVTFYQW